MKNRIHIYLSESKANRTLIKQFDKAFLSGYQSMGMRISAYIFDAFALFFMCFPYQALDSGDRVFSAAIILLSSYGTFFYTASYLQYREQNKQHFLLKKLRYLPINAFDFKVVRAEYLFRYKIKIALIALIAQVFTTLLAYHHISMLNFLYVFLFMVALPFFLGFLQIGLCKKAR